MTQPFPLCRYIAICHPFVIQQDASELSRGHDPPLGRRLAMSNIEPSRKRLYKYTYAVLIVSLLSNIPILFEFTTGFDTESNRTTISVAQLRTNEIYIVLFKIGFEGIVLMVIPFISMICLNFRIMYTLSKRRRRVNEDGSHRRATNDMNLATILVAMDVVFLVCNLGRLVVNSWEVFQIGIMKQCLKIGVFYKVKSYLKYRY